jgi:DtxR family Mn-dependent transcriptional regulator
MENYLKVIFELLEREARATTSSIAERMGIASPSVTAMIKKLARMNLVSYEPYRGVSLTPIGEKTALEVVRHHRLLELYLAQALGVPWDRVHDEAEKLEHVISEDLEQRMADALGDPAFDPHGAPIPSREGLLERVEAQVLYDVAPGSQVTVVEVDDRNPELLRYLGRLNLYPGTPVEVVGVDPCDGPLLLKSGDREFVLGRAAAKEILVSA